jgi:hypothetical protein
MAISRMGRFISSSNSWKYIFERNLGDDSDLDTNLLLQENGFIKGNQSPFSFIEFQDYVKSIFHLCRRGIKESIYEIGCGNGLFIATMANTNGIKLFGGSDLSINRIKKARSLFPKGTWINSDALQDTNISGFLFCNSVLQYFPDQEYLESFVHSLRKLTLDGMALLDIPKTNSPMTDFASRGFYNKNELFHLRISPEWLLTYLRNFFGKEYEFHFSPQIPLSYNNDFDRFNIIGFRK